MSTKKNNDAKFKSVMKELKKNTKSYMKRYIVKYQNDIDERVLEDFPELPYTEEELNEMNYKEMKEAFTNLVKAEDASDKLYQDEVVRHGRSE